MALRPRLLLTAALLVTLSLHASCGGKGSPPSAPPAPAAPSGVRVSPEPFTAVPPPAGGVSAAEPRVTALRIVPDPNRPSVGMGVEVQGDGPRGKGVEFEISWTKNGESAGTGRFLGVPAKRGDAVRVTVVPYDPDGYGKAVSLDREVSNAPPVVGNPVDAAFDNVSWSARIPAEDGDGDPLSFRLKEGPEGMAVDEGGRVTWRVPPGFSGTASATVVVSDGAGGESEGTFRVTIRKD